MKKPILYGGSIAVLGALAALGMSSGNKEHVRKKCYGPLKTVSGEIVHIDEDSFAFWSYHKAGNAVFDNIRVKDEEGLVHRLIYLGPSSYKNGDKVEGLDYNSLPGGISLEDLSDLLIYVPNLCQAGYVQADGIIR